MSRPFLGPTPSVHSPPSTDDSGHCSKRCACLPNDGPNQLAMVRSDLTPAGPSSLPNRTVSAAPSRRSVCTRSSGAGPPMLGDTGRAAIGRAGSFHSERTAFPAPLLSATLQSLCCPLACVGNASLTLLLSLCDSNPACCCPLP